MYNLELVANEEVILLEQGDGNYRREYTLYNYVEEKILGYASTFTFNSSYTEIERVAAEKGFGSILHDIVLMDFSPNEVRSALDLTEGSIRIWNYYFSRREDVFKAPLPVKETKHVLKYDEESLLYSYRLDRKKWFIDLKNKSKSVIYANKIDVDGLLIDGKFYFYNRYNDCVEV